MLTRAAPVVAIALVAFVVGVVAGAGAESSAAQRFVDAWELGDSEAMYAELTGDAREEYTRDEFERAYAEAERTATVESVSAGEAQDAESGGDDIQVVGMRFVTHAFGDLGGDLELPADDDGVAWEPHMVFPQLEPGESLTRRTRAPDRAPILASDGTPLAEGPAAARSQPVSGASAVVGEVGAPPAEEERAMAADGFPPGSLTGNSGLELAFNDRDRTPIRPEYLAGVVNQLAADDAVFGYPPSRVWGTPTTAMWVYRMGLEQAKRYLLTGDEIPAVEAARIGLILEAVPDDRLQEHAFGLASRMARLPLNQLQMLKLLCNQTAESMGMASTRTLGTLFDGIARHTQEGLDFVARSQEIGFRDAVRERDDPFGDYGSGPRSKRR